MANKQDKDAKAVVEDAKAVAKDAKEVAKEAKAVAASKAQEVGLPDKVSVLIEYIKKNPKLVAQVGATMLPVLIRMILKKKDKPKLDA